jgi:hypothetical protein
MLVASSALSASVSTCRGSPEGASIEFVLVLLLTGGMYEAGNCPLARRSLANVTSLFERLIEGAACGAGMA